MPDTTTNHTLLTSLTTTTEEPLVLPSEPTLDEWLNYSQTQIAEYVQKRKVSLMLSIDGTQRFYLTHRPEEEDDTPLNFQEYVEFVIKPMAQLYNLIYTLGVNTVLTTVLLPSNFERAGKYAIKAIEQSYGAFGGALFQEIYRLHNVKVALWGDYDVAPAAEPVRPYIEGLRESLVSVSSPNPTNSLLLGFCAGTATQEITRRSHMLQDAGVMEPTDEELRKACFAHGPERLDILIEAGWLKVGGLVPPLLDGGHTDTYDLAFLVLDLDEATLRRILYDHLFLRGAWSDDKQNYSSSDIKAMRIYYQANQGRLIGLGHLVEPGLWYPFTPATITPTQESKVAQEPQEGI